MNNEELSAFYDDYSHNYHSRSDVLKLLLMPFAFFVLLGFPGKYGSAVATYSNFVPLVFFILYGFFTLVPDRSKRPEKLKRVFKTAWKLFLGMFIAYIVLSVAYYLLLHPESISLGTPSVIKHAVFNFFVLNVWPFPIGNSIWFVQSLVYAFLFFMLAEKTGLSKLYIPVLIILSVFSLATGEFAAFIGFPIKGYSYIPGGAVTRAIPYMLVGMLLRKNVDKLSRIPQYVYIVLFPLGLMAAIAEIRLLKHIGKLVYAGHTVGFGIMAISLCCMALSKAKVVDNFFSRHGRSYSMRMYALCQPVSLIIWVVTAVSTPHLLSSIKELNCMISFFVCFLIALMITVAKGFGIEFNFKIDIKAMYKKIKTRKKRKDQTDEE